MVNQLTNLTIVFAVELGVAALMVIGFLISWSWYWSNSTMPGKRIRFMSAGSVLAGVVIAGLAGFYLEETRSSHNATIGARFDDISLTRWLVYIVAFGAMAFVLGKFYRMKKPCLLTFMASIMLSMALMAIATTLGVDSAARRWTFYGFALVAGGVALFTNLMCDWFLDSSKPAADECERGCRGMVRVWVTITWAGFYLWWLLGPFGIGTINVASTLTFENSAYLINEFVALWIPAMIIIYTYSPMAADMRNAPAMRNLHRGARKATAVLEGAPSSNGTRKGNTVLVVHTADARHH